MSAGLPNITGSTTPNATRTNSNTVTNNGALQMQSVKKLDNYEGNTKWSLRGGMLTFDAHNSNTIYGSSATVTPDSLKTLLILKY